MNKFIIRILVAVFIIAAGTVTASAQKVPIGPPSPPSPPPTPIDEYAIGYIEGLQYAQNQNHNGFIHMYDHYQEQIIRYPGDLQFYTDRLLGLVDGWSDNWLEYSGIDWADWNRLWAIIMNGGLHEP